VSGATGAASAPLVMRLPGEHCLLGDNSIFAPESS
jgi:hypothetical protein